MRKEKNEWKTTSRELQPLKKVIVATEDETIIIQKPCIRSSLSFEGGQQKIEHNGSKGNSVHTYPTMTRLVYSVLLAMTNNVQNMVAFL